MNKTIRIVLAGLLVSAVMLAPASSFAQGKTNKPPASGEIKPPSPRATPFRGTVSAVDKNVMSVTVGERTFHISSETKVMKNNQPATVGDLAVGDYVTGNYTTGTDGKLTAKLMRAGPIPPSGGKGKAVKPDDRQNAAEKE
jgi:hypothetical protein